VKTHLLPALGARLRFHDMPGSGRPLVLLHGLACASSSDYPRVVREPSLARRRCILVDLMGSGFSDRPAHFSYSVDGHAQAIVDLLGALDVPEVDLYGHSMGGTVAIVAASLRPERVRHLVVSEPNLDAGGGSVSRAIAEQPEADYVARGHAELIRAAVAEGNHVWAGAAAVSSAVAVHRTASSLVRGGAPPWRDRLLALPMPRTVVFGARSLPDPDAALLAEAGIAVQVVPEAGHSLMWENPAGLAAAIAAGI